MRASRVVVTAASERWALEAARSFTRLRDVRDRMQMRSGNRGSPRAGPDAGRPPRRQLLLLPWTTTVSERGCWSASASACQLSDDGVLRRPATRRAPRQRGGQLRYFGDRHQGASSSTAPLLAHPVMEGEFLVEAEFGITAAVGGGNFLILAESTPRPSLPRKRPSSDSRAS